MNQSPKQKKLNQLLGYLVQITLLLGITLLVYLPSFNSQFHLDDGRIIINNLYLRILDLKPASLFQASFQDGGNNRPLVNFSLALNYYLGKDNPFGYHLINFLILLFTAFGIWLLLLKLLTHLGYEHSRSMLAGWLIALLWAVHPLNIQAVTYISQRYASMAGAFSIWSIYFYHLALSRNKARIFYYLFTALFCLFAILSKEIALPLPLILLVYKLYFFDRFAPGWLKRNQNWILALTIFYLLIAFLIFRPEMLKRIGTDFAKTQLSLGQRLLSQPRALFWYLGLILFPFPQFLSLIHNFPASNSIFQPASTIICLLMFFLLVFLAIIQAKNWRIFSFTVFWYLAQLIIEAMPLPIDLVHEHRLYLASLAIISPAVALPVLKSNQIKLSITWTLLIIAFFAFFSWKRNLVWRTDEKLSRDTVKKNPHSSMVWSFYCKALGKSEKYHLAVPACKIAIQLAPDDYLAHFTLGVFYLREEQWELAEQELKQASEILPLEYGAHHQLGLCYLKTGRLELAEKELHKAVELCPESVAQPLLTLALLYSIKNDYNNAVKWFLATIDREPANAQAHYLLAQTYLQLKKEEEYLKALHKAVELEPGWRKARIELAWALREKKGCAEAISFIKTLRVQEPLFNEIIQTCQKP